jgi:hypothetical protein
LPPILGIPHEESASVRVEKFELEKSIVENLVCLPGWRNFVLVNPNLKEETGLDVAVEHEGKRFGFQGTDFHSDEGTVSADRGSELQRQESKKVKDGLPAAMCINPDPIPVLVRRIKDKSTKRWSRKDFPEVHLLITASLPELPAVVIDVPLGS